MLKIFVLVWGVVVFLGADLLAMNPPNHCDRSSEEILLNTTVHLMWVYPKKAEEASENAEFVMPALMRRAVQGGGIQEINPFERLNQWAAFYPRVMLWYDAAFLKKLAVQKTREAIKTQCAHWERITLSDVRDLETVDQNPCAFSEEVSVYARCDLLRILAAQTVGKDYPGRVFIYSDWSITPCELSKMFDPQSMALFHKYGFVMARSDNPPLYENSFFVLGNHKETLLKAHEMALIEKGIARLRNSDFFTNAQVIFNLYAEFFKVFAVLERRATFEPENPHEEKYENLGPDAQKQRIRVYIQDPDSYRFVKNSDDKQKIFLTAGVPGVTTSELSMKCLNHQSPAMRR